MSGRTRTADLAVVNAKVITVDDRFAIAEALSVADGRFLAVGDEAAVATTCGPGTVRIDAAGAAVMPGLIDGHAHMDREGLKEVFPSLAGCRSIDDVVARIADLARGKRPGEWIVTMPLGEPPYYWTPEENLREKRLPTRHDLDRAAPDNPVFIRPIWGFWRHTLPLVSIANSRALEIAGIGRHTAAPVATIEIDRDPSSGEPTGIFRETSFMPMIELSWFKAIPGFTEDDRVAALPASMRAYHAFGTTSIYEEHGAAGELLRAYMRCHESGAMTMRSHLVFSPDWSAVDATRPGRVAESWGAWLSGRGSGDDRLRVSGIFVDVGASDENALRAQSKPYTGWSGFNYDTGLPRDKAKELMLDCARLGIRVAGIWPYMLDLFAEVNEIVPIIDQRWILGHISTLSRDDVARIRDLGLVVTTHTNRYVFKEGHDLLRKLPPERHHEIVPLRALEEAGIRFALATDNVPVSMFYPIWQAVTRRNRYVEAPINPDQAIDRQAALRAATINGAFLTFEEDRKGSIEPGKHADFAILTADPLSVAEDEIKDIAARRTFVGGREVYTRDGS